MSDSERARRQSRAGGTDRGQHGSGYDDRAAPPDGSFPVRDDASGTAQPLGRNGLRSVGGTSGSADRFRSATETVRRSEGITGVRVDLVLLSLGGVQRFIGESRRTADVAGASEIIQRLAGRAAEAVHHRLTGSPAPCGLIFPPSLTLRVSPTRSYFWPRRAPDRGSPEPPPRTSTKPGGTGSRRPSGPTNRPIPRACPTSPGSASPGPPQTVTTVRSGRPRSARWSAGAARGSSSRSS